MDPSDFKAPADGAGDEKKRPPWLVPGYPPLEGKALHEAIKGQILRYPMVVRGKRDPPIPNQAFTNVSFIFLDKPQRLKTGKLVYGFFNPRGTWESVETATQKAEELVKMVDSRHQIRIAHTGMWHPITEDNAVCEDLLDVQTEEKEMPQLRDRAAKEAAEKQAQIQRELREREEQLRTEGDIYDDKDHIRYYSMRRVTEMRITERLETLRQEIAKLRHIHLKCRIELKQLEAKFPTHPDEWLECYNKERAITGIPPYQPGEHEFDEYEAATLDEMEREVAAYEAARDAE